MDFGQLKIPKINIEPYTFIHDYQMRLHVQYADIIKKTDLGRKVVQKLNEDPRVISLKGKMLSRGMSGANRFEVADLAMWFLWCANQYGQEKTTDHLNSYLDSETIEIINTLWVLGLEVDEPISLQGEYIIQPINDMPDSRDKELFLKRSFMLPAHNTPLPACAIIKTCHIHKVWRTEPQTYTASIPEFRGVEKRLNEIALLLNAFSGVSCIPHYSTSYHYPTTPTGPFGPTGGGGGSYDVLGSSLVQLCIESKDSIDALLDTFDSLGTLEKARTTMILNRLSQAKRRDQIEDKILDLGIALEMLLLSDNQKDQLSLSFRLRGSWLLGNSAEDRIKIYGHLRDIYKYRSLVAHSGVLSEGDRANVAESFLEYQSLAEDICQKIIKDGVPNWDKVVLNASVTQ